MAKRQLKSGSRLNYSELLESPEGFVFWGVPSLPAIEEQQDDIQYRWTALDRLEQVAVRFYNDPALWWVIAVANDIELHPTDISVGDLLTIPSPRYVRERFSRPRNQSPGAL